MLYSVWSESFAMQKGPTIFTSGVAGPGPTWLLDMASSFPLFQIL